MDKRLVEKKYFLWRIFTFSGYISPAQFWSELVILIIGFFCATIFLCIILSVAVPGDVEDVRDLTYALLPVFGSVWAIRILALTRRRLRDAGYSAKSYLWLLLPGIGVIAFLARLCSGTAPRKPEEIWFEYN